MKALKYLGFITCIGLLAVSCKEDNPNLTELTGSISEEEGPIILSYIDASKRAPIPLDTMEVVDGKFGFSWDVDSLNFYTLVTKKNYYIPILIEPGEKIELNITGTDADRDYTVTGSPGSARIAEINKVSKYAIARVDTLNEIANQFKDSANYAAVKVSLDQTFQKILDEAQAGMKKFIDEDPSSLTNLLIFSQSVARVELVPVAGNMAYYEKVEQAIEEKYPNNQHVKFFKETVARSKQAEQMRLRMESAKAGLAPGNPMPNIALNNPDGEVKSLSDLRGKVVLVDFWAAWCRPCRAENPNLVKLYADYKDKGFDVYSVSIDGLPQQPNPKQDWLNAIEQDGLVWPNHVSDLKGWTSNVVPQFGLQGIPFTVLIDRDGSIIATELRGQALRNKLQSIFGA